MGGVTVSKQESLTKTLNDTSLSVLNSISSNTQTSTVQQNTVIADGPASRNYNITQANKLNGEVASLLSAASSGALQQQLMTQLTSGLTQSSSTLGLSVSSSTAETVVTNAVRLSVKQEVMTQLTVLNKQVNEAIAKNGGENINVSQRNFLDLKTSLSQSISTSIVSQLENDTQIKNTLAQKVSNPLSDILGNPSTLSLVVIGIIAIVAGGFLLRQLRNDKPGSGSMARVSGGDGGGEAGAFNLTNLL